MLVGTESFLKLARYETARRGVIEPRMVLVEHPLGGADEAAIVARADAARVLAVQAVRS